MAQAASLRHATHAYPYGNTDVSQVPYIGKAAAGSADVIMDLTGGAQGIFSMLSALQHEVNAVALSTLGSLSCLSVMTGPVLIGTGIKERNLSQKTKDFWGEVMADLQLTRGVLQTGAGVMCIVPASAISLALFVVTCSVAATAAAILLQIGGCVFAATSLIQGASSIMELVEDYQCRKLLNSGSPEQVLAKIQEALKTTAEARKWQRAIGAEMEEKIDLAQPEDAAKLIAEVKTALLKNAASSSLTLTLCISAVVLTILSFCLTGGTASAILAFIGTAIGVIWLLLDAASFIDALRNEKVGSMEKPWLAFNALFCGSLLGISLYSARSNPLVLSIILILAILILLIFLASLMRNLQN